MENINSECDIILKWIFFLSKHLSEQELTSHMSLRTKRGRFSENFPILNRKYFNRILYLYWHIKQLQELFYMIWTKFKIQLLQNSLAILTMKFFLKHEKNLINLENILFQRSDVTNLANGLSLASLVQMSVFFVKFYSSPLNILKSYYCVIKVCSDVRS